MITIDGRGLTPTEAVRDLWMRMQPLTQKGYNPISEVEIIDTKTKKVVEHFLVTDPEFELHTREDARKATGEMHRAERAQAANTPRISLRGAAVARVIRAPRDPLALPSH